MKLNEIREILSRQGLKIFSSNELRRFTGLSSTAIRLWIVRSGQKGLILPLKKRRGLYCFADSIPHSWLVANRLYQPSYISLETALSHYGLLLESVYPITSVTPKTTRVFRALGKEFVFQKIKSKAFGGCRPTTLEGQTVLLAEKEKALADYLYFIYLGRKVLPERLRLSPVNKKTVAAYLKRFDNENFMKWGQDVITRRR